MQTPPDDLTPDRLLAAVRRGWLPGAVTADYLPVGFGSHHWRVEDRSGTPWFASADEVDDDDGLDLLDAAFGVAAAARAAGVVGAHGPLPSHEGPTVLRAGRWAVSVQPWVDGRAGSFSDRWDSTDAEALVRLLAGLHDVDHPAPAEEHDLPGRADLERSLAEVSAGRTPPGGALREAVADLLAPRLGAVRRGLDALDAPGSGDAGRLVVTHGEPHPGNVVRTTTGLVLVDWDTARRAEPERDLWLVAARTDLDVAARYEELTGRVVDRSRLRARERRWALADVASFVPDLLAAQRAGADTAWQLEALARTLDTL